MIGLITDNNESSIIMKPIKLNTFFFSKLKRELPDLDSQIHLTLRIDDGTHRRRLPLRHAPLDPVARDPDPHLLALQPLHPHLHLRIHLNHHREPLLLLQPRSQRAQRVRVQILRPRHHRPQARLVVLVGLKRRQRPVPDEDRVQGCRNGKGVVEEHEVVIGVLGDEREVEERGEV